jgi:hypothetical protein
LDRDQLAYVPELFDIHVMAFADESDAAVGALQEIFRIERSEAERLIADAPVVVKRAATPDVAEVLLDALTELGAQVVLMPAREREPARAAAPVAAPAQAPAAATAATQPAGARWGGLDFAAEQPRTRRAPPEVSNPANSIPAALADSIERDVAPKARKVESALLELDVPTSRSNDRLRAVLAANERSRARAPAAEMSLPPSRRESLPPSEASLPPVLRSGTDAFDHAPLSSPLAPASLRPRPPAAAPSAPRAVAPPSLAPPPAPPPPAPIRAMPPPAPQPPPAPSVSTRKATAGPPPPPPPPPHNAAPARRPGGPPPPPPPDLGLGTVPPLPLLAGPARSESLPPRKAGSSPRPPARDNPRFEHRIVDAGEAMKLPRIDVSTPLLRPSPSADAAAAASHGKASASHANALTDAGPKPARSGGREPSTRIATQGGHGAQVSPDGTAAQAEAAPAKPKPPPARGRALLEIGGGILIFYVGLHMGSSILHGEASLTWTAFHAFALYGIGSGIAGLWP